MMLFFPKKFIYWFSEITIKDIPKVGGKNASLGEMYQKLTTQGVHVPNGFAISAGAYFYLLKKTGIRRRIRKILADLNTADLNNLISKGLAIRQLILEAPLPADLETQIISAYHKLEAEYGKHLDVAVRSSATAEDLPNASFAGQQETFLNIRGDKDLLVACRKCFASLFTNRAISYRHDKGFDHFKVGLSIGVQKMVRADLASSGVMFTIDTETGFRNLILINGSWGLGENIVQGKVTPDEFYVFKPTLEQGFSPIISKKLGSKEIKMVYTNRGEKQTKNIKTTKTEQQRFVLTDKEILKLAEWGILIEDHYGKPMDIEWAKDGRTKKLFIVQARPETVVAMKSTQVLEEYQLEKKGKILVSGSPVGAKIGAGKANIILDVKKINQFKAGEILVTDMTDPDWEPIMKIGAGIVTNQGGRTCHAAIVSRELGIPCIVGTAMATKKIKSGQSITLSCTEGEIGYVYDGILPYKIKKTNLKKIKRPKTKIMLNIGQPDIAFSSSFIPNDGVGLAREEFIIANQIKVHPLALINFHQLKDKKAKKKISELTLGYKNKPQYFVDKLAEGIGQIAAAFYPKEVIFRLSDFKTNEYANLIGGWEFEPKEANPMLGWRGAARYYSPNYQAAFLLECKAFLQARQIMGLKNINVMVPFCRTVEEGKKVIAIMEKAGLKRGQDGLEFYVMCEIPSNVILGEEFAEIFDGFSIGSNDLTQLALGVDRDSELVSHIYDERNESVKKLIAQVIKIAKKKNRKIGICGQAPSDFPDFARFLVKQGIDTISLNPDTVIKTTLAILEEEKKLRK
ncbi:MAG: phosphoenolpyruvate synthase [Candidatus Buchananbacteria bacterium RIFCSPHIGHO2_01_FULL_39_14]|uniref:Phosphoenolpyruvate synthase n=2 Tax=Candidatus Buchananiibacteriota TaxID=1817903 RepID=A0A1G1YQ03_9BACT|nr:MAG: phosphoenolpyruvate synthase [Candidatus Buchananbacteria bacterium RIFCSPHIGHO2_01_FULL_39_14]OGY48745.1 MAG: phosphoenolpyruvate synthase [Candidatus Buchananbacteria bacterium RIFCSPHIGHO2_02_FULL_39_17]OGY53517.1 MAG: phosphoenolpyruvate synthase [Candidatus Buchananbacteria bacterium RIFCSPLOWO2_01_FULL_40_23b]